MRKSNSILAMVIGIMLAGGLSAPAAACGAGEAGTRPPAIGAAIDMMLATAVLSDTDHARVLDLRAQVATLVASGQFAEARARETEALLLLGYRRVYSHCGPGSGAAWIKLPPAG